MGERVMRRFNLPGLVVAGFAALATWMPAQAAEDAAPPHQHWEHGAVNRPFSAPFGTFDRAALQRGYQVYKEVCAACHSLNLVAFRHLTEIGFNEAEVKALAAQYDVEDGPNDAGETFTRKALPSDHFKAPFPNEKAARAANNGAYPVDLSLVVKARAAGEDYVFAILTGYKDAPAGVTLPVGMSYNEYFPGHQIAMPAPLTPDRVTYTDGTAASVAQQAHDVATFLAWAAEPQLEARKQIGALSILFLVVLSGILYYAKRKTWSDLH
jgi:ubiquinol-cytochrome c reductase cytochrome c1 subunit